LADESIEDDIQNHASMIIRCLHAQFNEAAGMSMRRKEGEGIRRLERRKSHLKLPSLLYGAAMTDRNRRVAELIVGLGKPADHLI
jgi:hypothetical protein